MVAAQEKVCVAELAGPAGGWCSWWWTWRVDWNLQLLLPHCPWRDYGRRGRAGTMTSTVH